jgi:MFS family permease
VLSSLRHPRSSILSSVTLGAARSPLFSRLCDCNLLAGGFSLCREPRRDRARRRLGWFSSSNDIGATAGPLIGGFVLYFSASYAVTYLLVGVIGMLTLLVVLWLPDTDRPQEHQTTTLTARAAEFREGLAEVVATPPIFLAAGIEALMYLGYGAFLGFLPIYAKTAGLNDAEIAIVLGSQLATAVVAKPIGGRLSDRLGRRPVIVIGLLLCAAALPMIFRSEDFVIFVVVAPLLGLGIAAVTPVTNALIADLASARRLGAAMGVFGTIGTSARRRDR